MREAAIFARAGNGNGPGRRVRLRDSFVRHACWRRHGKWRTGYSLGSWGYAGTSGRHGSLVSIEGGKNQREDVISGTSRRGRKLIKMNTENNRNKTTNNSTSSADDCSLSNNCSP